MRERYLSPSAEQAFVDNFVNSFYIGRHQIYPDGERRPHKFFYIGYRDAFGVKIPEPRNRYSYQIWGRNWIEGRTEKLDKALRRAMRGRFPECRHNVQIEVRAKSHGNLFKKPEWLYKEKAPVVEKENFPIRGRRKKRTRRQLTI